MKTEVNNFWKAYLEYDEEDLKETREFLKDAGIDIEAAKNKFSELLRLKEEEIKNEEAQRRKEEGKRKQEIFDKSMIKEKFNKITGNLLGNTEPQLQFREGEQIGEDEKNAIVERDRKKLERFRRENKEGDEE